LPGGKPLAIFGGSTPPFENDIESEIFAAKIKENKRRVIGYFLSITNATHVLCRAKKKPRSKKYLGLYG
jgi:hypothetical protein